MDTPLHSDASRFLKDVFLDPVNRYLVFTTHVPFSIDVTKSEVFLAPSIPNSPRLSKYLQLPTSTTVSEFQSMDALCAAVTPMQIAYLGGVPSLVYATLQPSELKPRDRFTLTISAIYKDVDFNDADHKMWFYYFVHAFLTGDSDHVPGEFNRFCSVVDTPAGQKHAWPPCYMLHVMHL